MARPRPWTSLAVVGSRSRQSAGLSLPPDTFHQPGDRPPTGGADGSRRLRPRRRFLEIFYLLFPLLLLLKQKELHKRRWRRRRRRPSAGGHRSTLAVNSSSFFHLIARRHVTSRSSRPSSFVVLFWQRRRRRLLLFLCLASPRLTNGDRSSKKGEGPLSFFVRWFVWLAIRWTVLFCCVLFESARLGSAPQQQGSTYSAHNSTGESSSASI